MNNVSYHVLAQHGIIMGTAGIAIRPVHSKKLACLSHGVASCFECDGSVFKKQIDHAFVDTKTFSLSFVQAFWNISVLHS